MSGLLRGEKVFVAMCLGFFAFVGFTGAAASGCDLSGSTSESPPGDASIQAAYACSKCAPVVTTQGFEEVDLVSDLPIARFQDPDLVNPWGLVLTRGCIWTADNGTGLSTVYKRNGEMINRRIIIPAPDGGAGTPTGMVQNSTLKFLIKPGLPAKFLWATEDGTIVAWNPLVKRTAGVIVADRSKFDAVYKGIALGSNVNGHFIFATDFHNARVDVFNARFQKVGSFTDPDPELARGNFAPFGIRSLGGLLYVTYAKQILPDKEDDEAGQGNGFVDVFNTRGKLLRRLVSHGPLNSPWGLEIFPACTGRSYPVLAVGNFGDGMINTFALPRGNFIAPLSDNTGSPIVIDGLWGIMLSCVPDTRTPGECPVMRLFFTAGINDEANGLLGYLFQPMKMQ
jgi:uncharacterized protein (TIGR03118 family)